MPGTLNGIGTTYYGAKDRLPDGSFITTEWFVFFAIPILPLKSLRVMHIASKVGLFSQSRRYYILQQAPLDLGQIVTVYFGIVFSLAVAIGIAFLASLFLTIIGLPDTVQILAGLFAFVVSFVVVGRLFLKAE